MFKALSIEETRARMEALLGEPTKLLLSASGFLEYACPFPSCSGNHFGVCYDPNAKFSLGTWSCFKCASSGVGPYSLAKALGRQETVSAKPIIPLKQAKPSSITKEQFSKVWSHLQKISNLSQEHAAMLLKRGIEPDKLPGWFTVPKKEVLFQEAKFFGEELAENALLVQGNRQSYFTNDNRLAIVYPDRPWKEEGHCKFIATYKQGAKQFKILRPRGLSTEGILYYRGFESGTLVVTEGEIKAEASYQAGLSTIGMLGVGNGRREVVECIAWLKPKRILFVFDRDIKQTSVIPVEAAIAKLVNAVKETTDVPIVRIILPETEPLKKVDIDSFIEFHAKQVGLVKARQMYRNLLRK